MSKRSRNSDLFLLDPSLIDIKNTVMFDIDNKNDKKDINVCNNCGQYILKNNYSKNNFSKNILCECIPIKHKNTNICNIS